MQYTADDLRDDLRWANETALRYEQQFQMSSAEFLALYNQGQLDDGENMKAKAEWSAACQIKETREKELALLEDARSADSKAD